MSPPYAACVRRASNCARKVLLGKSITFFMHMIFAEIEPTRQPTRPVNTMAGIAPYDDLGVSAPIFTK